VEARKKSTSLEISLTGNPVRESTIFLFLIFYFRLR
jgi:hypothetical protein